MIARKTNAVWNPARRALFTVIALALTGCGSVRHQVTFQDGYAPRRGVMVEVGEVTNETQQTFDVDVEQMMTDALAEALRNESMLATGGDSLAVSTKVVEYAKGNAFKRWLLPGWGTTVLSVQCDIRDGSRLVGSAQARRTVSFGGGYTIGAWRTVFASVAKDMAKDLRRQTQRQG